MLFSLSSFFLCCPHLDNKCSAKEWYNTWKKELGGIFHGIDWDLEGHDDLRSPTNKFSLECLDKMGRISQYAHDNGHCIGIAPPQSYLDLHNRQFSCCVNLTHSERPWHADFHYFGKNVYAYLLAKYQSYVDFVSIQFYKSYSRAGMSVYYHKMAPSKYLESYVNQLVEMDEAFPVDFDQDPTVGLPSQKVPLPLPKLVLGFANGWALNMGDKALYFKPKSIQIAYQRLQDAGRAPRGFMFWELGEEGTNGIKYAIALGHILQIRDSQKIKRRRTEDRDL